MKLDTRQAAAFLRDPGEVRAVLLFGDDEGLIRERATLLSVLIAGSSDDPFRVCELDREAHGRLSAEIAALSLTGGRRVILVRDASDSLVASLQRALDSPGEALLVLMSGSLPARSKLRALIEKRNDSASLGCYRDEGRNLEQVIRQFFADRRLMAHDGVVEWLSGQLGLDRGATRQELEKIALYVGADGKVDLESALASVGDVSGLQTDDALFSATAGDVEGTDRALELALAEGEAPVAIIRAGIIHIQRLQRANALMCKGVLIADAAKSSRPPIFYRRIGDFERALKLWNASSLATACEFLATAERNCKRTGSPSELLCRHAITSIARRSASVAMRNASRRSVEYPG